MISYKFSLAMLVALSSTLCACATVDVARTQSVLSSTSTCCTTYKDIQSEGRLVLGERYQFELSEASPVFRFPPGLAYFGVVEIPSDASQLKVETMNTEYLPGSTYADPLIVILDSSKQVIAQYGELPLQPGRFRYLAAFLKYYYGATISLPQDAKYAVVAGNPRSTRIQTAISENGRRWPVKPAPVGTIGLVAIKR